jgi:hypothetical protein
VDSAEIRLLSGEVFIVAGSLEEVEKRLSDAARSGQSRLAWFEQRGEGGPVGINPAHVASLRRAEGAD